MAKLVCDKCGSSIPAGSKFCPQCADPVTDADVVAEDAAPTEESVRLVCPKCQDQGVYAVDLSKPNHSVVCAACKTAFQTRIVQVRAKKSRGSKKEGKRSFSVRVHEFSGGEDLIEFDNAGYEDFELRSKDLAAFNYLKDQLRIVQNLNVGRYLAVSKPGCYLATMVYGYGSEEVAVLRKFRDTILLPNRILSLLVRAYYTVGPWVVAHLGPYPLLRRATRLLLAPLVAFARVLVSGLRAGQRTGSDFSLKRPVAIATQKPKNSRNLPFATSQRNR